MNFDWTYLRLAFAYIQLTIFDYIDYYYKYMILSLPHHIFGAPVIHIQQQKPKNTTSNNSTNNIGNTSSDSSGSGFSFDYSSSEEEEIEVVDYDVFITKLILSFSHKNSVRVQTRTLNGLQLKPLLTNDGRFFIGHLQQYYSNLNTVIVKYLKIPSDCNDVQISDTQLDDIQQSVKIIDVVKCYDIRNHESCRFGVYL